MADELLTILFTDVEGSTALHAVKGDSEARRILGACDELVRQQVRDHGGREIKSTGDGFLIAFGSPRRAVACALAIQEATAKRGDAVRVRAGLHTGEVSEEGGDLFGGAVNAAARICARAQGGEVLVSDVVRQLCGTSADVILRERGLFKLKGFPDRWRLYHATPHVRGTPVGERTPFVGREAERAELRTLMRKALTGQGGLVMIGGEPGVGKTRLCEEAAAEGERLGMRVLTGHCYEHGGDLPYMPWVELVEAAMADTSPISVVEALGDAAPEMARIVPQLRRLFPEIPPPLELPPEQQRRFTFTVLADYVERMARVQPRLYVLEDLHWADDSTLLFLTYLAERLGRIPVLALGTFRDLPIEMSPILGKALAELVRARSARRVTLRRHSRSEVEQLLLGLSGQAPPATVVGVVHTETEGNAFFIEEIYRHLQETGQLLDEQGQVRPDLTIDEVDVPENVRLVTGRRLDRLDEVTRNILIAGAVIGRQFSCEVLAEVLEASEDEVLDAVDEARRARLLIAEPTGAHALLHFSHEIVRQAVLTRLSSPRLERYHLRVADTLERRATNDVAASAADIAHHLLHAGGRSDPARTVHHLRIAADQALAATAFENALRHLDAALQLLPAQDSGQRADLLFTRGLALRGAGRWNEAMAAWRDALKVSEKCGDTDLHAHLCAEMALHHFWCGRMAEAVEMAGLGLSIIGDALNADRPILLGIIGFARSYSGDFAVAERLTASAVALAEEFGNGRALGYTLNLRTIHHFMWQRCGDCIAQGLRGAEVLKAGGDVFLLVNHLCIVEHALLWLGRLDEARTIGEEVAPLARRIGHHGATAVDSSVRLYGEILAGRLDAVERSALDLLAMCREHGLGFVADFQSLLGLASFWRGDWDRAAQYCEEGIGAAIPGVLAGAPWAFSFLIHAYRGDRDATGRLLEARPALPPPEGPLSISGLTTVRALVEGLTIMGRNEEASPLYPLVRARIQEGMVLSHWDMRLLHAVGGLAAAAAGEWEASEGHYQAALRQADALPHRLDQPEVQRLYAMMLMDRGGPRDTVLAAALLREAVAGYHRIGMPRHEAMARELLVRVDSESVRG